MEYSASGFTLARTCISVNPSNLKVMDLRTDGGFPTLALSLSESNGSTEVKKQLSRRGDCGTVKLGCYFHTHDFRVARERISHGRPPDPARRQIVSANGPDNMRTFWPRSRDRHQGERPRGFHTKQLTPRSHLAAPAWAAPAPMINEATPNVPLMLRQRCLERSMTMKI